MLRWVNEQPLTLLDKLKPVRNIALIANEQQPTILGCLPRPDFLLGQLRSELDTAADYSASLRRDTYTFEVGSWICLSNVRGERAAVLGVLIIRKDGIEAEVVIAGRVST